MIQVRALSGEVLWGPKVRNKTWGWNWMELARKKKKIKGAPPHFFQWYVDVVVSFVMS